MGVKRDYWEDSSSILHGARGWGDKMPSEAQLVEKQRRLWGKEASAMEPCRSTRIDGLESLLRNTVVPGFPLIFIFVP
ncbi:uncharacterized protein H6S33_000865 [Morchella sextelata]|uniref:uncharacterized protein n=1 Tax=Morchella sextelata TaxID=1174677 RepID=UPI001D045C89|nr:uncharacterized protein H6S33_000865 [Morchella sextelata]KAH0615229.1 hypothetical protein H6S33_000865 [Morchella sextelata]